MRRGISNKATLVANLTIKQQTKEIEAAGGYEQFGQPNRETRRRMEREARREAKKGTKA